VESAVAQAKAAARDKAVQVVGGVNFAQQLLDAGLVYELHVDIMPVFLGIGLRSFESSKPSARPARENQRAASRRENKPQISREAVVDLVDCLQGMQAFSLSHKIATQWESVNSSRRLDDRIRELRAKVAASKDPDEVSLFPN
jgi:hypothetical protein